MSKPIYWVIAVAAVLAVLWAASRNKGEPSQDSIAHVTSPAAVSSDTSNVAAGATTAPKAEPPRPIPNATAAPVGPGSTIAEATATGVPGENLPIDVSPGFELLNQKASSMKGTDQMRPLIARHEEIQSEARDPNWATQMEAALRKAIQDALTAKGLDTQRIELPVVECRTTGCEIQAVGYPEDNGKQGVDLQLILPSLVRGSLSSEFEGFPQILMRLRPDRRITFLAFLQRRGVQR